MSNYILRLMKESDYSIIEPEDAPLSFVWVEQGTERSAAPIRIGMPFKLTAEDIVFMAEVFVSEEVVPYVPITVFEKRLRAFLDGQVGVRVKGRYECIRTA
jgi:hypothetical protein